MKFKRISLNENITGDVNISNKNLTEIPIQFGIVKGNFWCRHK